MNPKLLFVSVLVFKVSGLFGQSTPLGQPVNTGASEEYNPSVSANGRTLIFEQLYFNQDNTELMISYQKSGAWSRPEPLPAANSELKSMVNSGYSMNANGSQIWMHSSRAGGVGGLDIWVIEKTITGSWSAAKNLGKPINSAGQEVDPHLSSDGRFLFFTRLTEKKNDKGTPCGKIFMSERNGKDGWKTPVELPAPVNSGCECTARLLHDNKTLVFASQREGGMGGFDLYRAQWQSDNTWSAPEAMSFINTPEDDRYVSIPAGGGIVYHTGNAKTGGRDIFRTKVPDNLAPDKVTLISGTLKNASTNLVLPPRVAVNAIGSNKGYQYYGAADGTYTICLPVGDVYDVAVQTQEGGYSFQSSLFNLKNSTKYEEKVFDAKVSPIKPGLIIPLNNTGFQNNTDTALVTSMPELNRLFLLMKGNVTMRVELGVHSDRNDIDTIRKEEFTYTVIDTVSRFTDSTGTEYIKTRTSYSNNNTVAQSKAIAQWLIKKGIPTERIVPKGYGNAVPPSDKRPARRVELKVLHE